MSAHIVDHSTIDQILTFTGIFDDSKDLSELGQKLVNLNTEVISWRRSHYIKPEVYEFCPVVITEGQALKAMKTYLYQCAEGEFPTNPLFIRLGQICNDLNGKNLARSSQVELWDVFTVGEKLLFPDGERCFHIDSHRTFDDRYGGDVIPVNGPDVRLGYRWLSPGEMADAGLRKTV